VALISSFLENRRIEMVRNLGSIGAWSLAGIALFCAGLVITLEKNANGQMLGTWNIGFPNSNQLFRGNIGASGMATTGNVGFSIDVKRASNNESLSSASGTSVGTGWSANVPEPNDGWPTAQTDAVLELWVGTWKADTQDITVQN
jgi:hypothetical protein